MSEHRPPSTDRWIAPLGLALVVAAGAASLPLILAWAVTITDKAVPLLTLLTNGLLPVACGILLLASSLGTFSLKLTVRVAFATIVGLAVSDLVQQLPMWDRGSSIVAFQPVSSLLIGIGAPMLWGSALARVDHPDDSALQKYGRIGAGLVQLGFVFQFVVRVRNWDAMASAGGSGPAASAGLAMATLTDIAANVLLVWASVEAMRAALDDDAVRRRALRTHRLMIWSLLLVPVSSGLFHASFAQQPVEAAALFTIGGRMTVTVALQAATAFVLARWYRLQFPASTSPMDRSGGVQSTGEPS